MKLFFALLLIIMFGSLSSYSCTCIGKENVAVALKKADVVFVGKVVNLTTFKTHDSGWDVDSVTRIKCTIEITHVFKGRNIKHKKIVSVITGLGRGGDCGFIFNTGEEYVIYANYKTKFYERGDKVPKYLYTHSCTRTCQNNIQEIKQIESSK